AGLWKCGQGKRLDHSPTGEQKQKKRTFDVLPKPAKLISYRQLQRAQRTADYVARRLRRRMKRGRQKLREKWVRTGLDRLVVSTWHK
ncbi:MAG: hypothetical protein ACLP4V_18180, partial [Methylocella sp.]